MPSRNVIKDDLADNYYHIYNRGVNKQPIFRDEKDYEVFFSLFKRYLSTKPQKDKNYQEYPNYRNDIELLAICLMPNHYHLLCYQINQGAMTKLLRSVGTAYTMYFNKKYRRVGPLFQTRFRASRITEDSYLLHISRYIHLNPKYPEWRYTSLPYYRGEKRASWINPVRVLHLFADIAEYDRFLSDYEDYKSSLDEIELATGGLWK